MTTSHFSTRSGILRWGILGTGRIARTFAHALNDAEHCELIAVGSRSAASAAAFAARFPQVRAHTHSSYTSLLLDPAVEAVYICTPHDSHAQWAIRALDAGKAVLCEKPLAVNHAEAMAMVERARRNRLFLMEAFMYRLHPQMRKVQELLDDGAIGQVRHVEASFGYHAPFDPNSRVFNNARAGGGILDVGCYPLSFARTIIGTEPLKISAHGHLGATGVDEWCAALLKFADGVSAQISAAVSAQLANTATVYGSSGQIHLPQPWLPGEQDGHWQLELSRDGHTETISGADRSLYTLEAEHVTRAVSAGATESAILTWQDSLNNALALDQWRRAIGLTYRQEQPATHKGPLPTGTHKGQLATGHIAHLDKPVARLIMGCDNQPSMSHASVMWDDYMEAGGNCFDTAHIYGDGVMETLLGHWHTQRGAREEIVIIGKGAHTPNNFPHHVSTELDISLQRLQTDYVDVYFLHRDNPEVPVAEFIDILNTEVQRGRIRAFGGSNWSLARVQAANEYAAANGLQGFSAVSNNFSLALMQQPIWPGVEAATSAEFKDYLTRSQLALMPWSSQARGFFTPWAEQVAAASGRENQSVTAMQPTMAELKRVWFSRENFERRERAAQLAEKYGVELINIALAYVLCQPFPTFPLVGPRMLSETASCISSLEIPLTAEEVAWLECGEASDHSAR